jgi:hypothetical protein
VLFRQREFPTTRAGATLSLAHLQSQREGPRYGVELRTKVKRVRFFTLSFDQGWTVVTEDRGRAELKVLRAYGLSSGLPTYTGYYSYLTLLIGTHTLGGKQPLSMLILPFPPWVVPAVEILDGCEFQYPGIGLWRPK